MQVFTIGHGAHTLEDVAHALRDAGVAELADVRRYPGSRRHPQFGRDALAEGLAAEGIGYRHWPALGGRRTQPRDDRRFAALTNDQFAAYAAHMTGEEWREAFGALRERAAGVPLAIMCAETPPFRCHRRMVADALAACGDDVLHLYAGSQRQEPHRIASPASVSGGVLRYGDEVAYHCR
jgi:uncharacterized protein (DUF488 family)